MTKRAQPPHPLPDLDLSWSGPRRTARGPAKRCWTLSWGDARPSSLPTPTDRPCLARETEPHFAEVALRHWEAFTVEKAKKVS